MALTSNEKVRIIALQLGVDVTEAEQGIAKFGKDGATQLNKFFSTIIQQSANSGERISEQLLQSLAKGLRNAPSGVSNSISELINNAIKEAGLNWSYSTKHNRLTTGSGNISAANFKNISMNDILSRMSSSIPQSLINNLQSAINELAKQTTRSAQQAQKGVTNGGTQQITLEDLDRQSQATAVATNQAAQNTAQTATNLDNSTQNLNNTVNALNSTIQNLNPQLENLTNAIGTMATANTNINTATQQLDQAATRLSQASGEISTSAHTLATAINSAGATTPPVGGGTGGGNSGQQNTPRISQDPSAYIAEFDRDAEKGFNLAAATSQKANAAIINAKNIFDKFKNNYGSLLRNITELYDDRGNLTRINAQLRLSSRQSARISLAPEDMTAIMNQFGKLPSDINFGTSSSGNSLKALTDMILAKGGVSSTSRVYVDEVNQVERYKALLTEQYNLETKIYEAQQNQDVLLQNKLRYQLELNNAEKEMLNRARDAGNRSRIDNAYGDMSDPESVAFLNQRLAEKNNLIQTAIDTRVREDRAAQEQIRLEQELTNLVSERSRLQSKLSGLTTNSKGYTDAQARLTQVNTAIEGYRGRIADDRYNTLTSSNLTQQQQDLMTKLTRLETERFQAWKNTRSAMQKGNTEEAAEYQKIARARFEEYNSELRSAEGMSLINNELRSLLNRYIEYNQTLQRIDTAKNKDVQRQKQEADTYKNTTSDLNKYVALLKEKSKLEATKDTSGSGIYASAYANVNAQISQLTTNFSKLIDIQSNGTLQLKTWSEGLGITKEQYDKLNVSIQNTNQIITNNAIQAKQEQDLQMINKMVEAYTRLKTAQMQLQQAKDRNYNDAEIARRTREVQLAEEHFNKLKQENSELAKSETYRNAMANADSRMNASISNTNQNMTQQLTLLQRLRNNLQRTAAVAFNFNIFNRIFMELRQGISNVIQKVKDFDKAMTDIQMVTGKTDSSTKQLLANYSELAKELGTTTEAVSSGSIEWLRQGKTAEETTKLLKASTMMSTLGAMESSDATQKLTA